MCCNTVENVGHHSVREVESEECTLRSNEVEDIPKRQVEISGSWYQHRHDIYSACDKCGSEQNSAGHQRVESEHQESVQTVGVVVRGARLSGCTHCSEKLQKAGLRVEESGPEGVQHLFGIGERRSCNRRHTRDRHRGVVQRRHTWKWDEGGLNEEDNSGRGEMYDQGARENTLFPDIGVDGARMLLRVPTKNRQTTRFSHAWRRRIYDKCPCTISSKR